MTAEKLCRRLVAFAATASLLPAFHVASGGEAAAPGKPVIAIIAADTNQQTQVLLDLLTVKLSQGGKMDVVERKTIEKVLAEQKIAAAGLMDTDKRILIGKILRANGLLFLEKDSRRDRMKVKLVESGQGFQVSQ